MAEIYVRSSGDLQDVINQLRELNNHFRDRAEAIHTEERTLTTHWEGDASTAFQEHFENEYPNFEAFATTVDDYINGLTQIKDSYESAEEVNKGIASN